jgi:hypothetical protein
VEVPEMENNIVLLSYALAFLFAVSALYWFGKARWYWHALSFGAAIGLGLMPPLPWWSGPGYDMAIGSAFIALLVWGVGEPIYDAMHLPHHRGRTHHA